MDNMCTRPKHLNKGGKNPENPITQKFKVNFILKEGEKSQKSGYDNPALKEGKEGCLLPTMF